MWERTLQDLIRGLRANKKDESKFIAQAIHEIRNEIRTKDMELKAGAVLKLTYLDMLGYDMSWASFHVVEVMSSPRFHLKSVGYLAAAQSFEQETDVLMLTTNLLKKDLASSPADIAVALNGLTHFVTPDLARDVSSDLIAMLTHSRAHIRKRAVLALYKVFLKYPEALAQGMVRLRERLEDPDSGVVSATVNVLCELARQRPQEYLPLAPQLFHLLTTSSNNWMLIKIIKLFGSLCPHEPRLVKKLQPPITELISTTPAISLLYECVHTCIIGGMLQGSSGSNLARTCVTKLAAFIQDSDQNLKYIALLAMAKIVPSHPHLVAEYQDMIISSVDDQDISIRMRALDLLSAMVDQGNLQSIVQQLLSHLVRPETSTTLPTAAQSLAQHTLPTSPTSAKPHIAPSQSPAYRLTLATRILALCARDTYTAVADFEWYLSVLVDLAYVARVPVGAQIRDHLVDVVGRVRGARRYAVALMVRVLGDETFVLGAEEAGSCAEVLWAAAWICGEYCSELVDPQKLLTYLLQPSISTLSPETIAVYIQAATKIFGYWATELAQRWDDSELPRVKEVVADVIESCRHFVASPHFDVQERAANTLQLFAFIQADLNSYKPRPLTENGFGYADAGSSSFDPIAEPHFPKSLYLIRPLCAAYELNPVAASAQASVPVPEGLDLDVWIVPPPAEAAEESAEAKVKSSKKGKGKDVNGTKAKAGKKKAKDGVAAEPQPLVESPEERAEHERRKAERLERLKDDPYYIIDRRPSPAPALPSVVDVESIPVVRLDDLPSLAQNDDSRLPDLRPGPAPITYTVDKDGEMPDGARIPSLPPSRPSSQRLPSVTRNSSAPSIHSPFPQYTEGDADTRTSTPEPIKVVKAKKKGTGAAKKKKRTAQLDSVT